MRKLLLLAIMAFGIAVNAQERELNVGGTVGIPVGDASAFNVTGAIEANYLFKVSDDFKVGPSVSYLHFQGKGPDAAYLPLSAAGRYNVSEKIILGTDLGYGIGVRPTTGAKSGFYYRALVGYKVTDKITIHVDYSGMSVNGNTAASIGLGGVYSFSL